MVAAAGVGAGGAHRPSLDSHASLTPEALLSPGLAAKYGSSTGGSSLPTSLPSGEALHLPSAATGSALCSTPACWWWPML